MRNKQFSLDREFIRWFFEDTYPELGSNRSMVFSYGNPMNKENRDYWMRECYKAGAEAMWLDVNNTLLAYACATEGLDPELLTPSEVYDRARENLHGYVYTQQELFK